MFSIMLKRFINLKLTNVPLLAVVLLFVSCGEVEDQYSEEPYDTHPHWTSDSSDNFWNKQSGGFQIDTAWDGDTTINL